MRFTTFHKRLPDGDVERNPGTGVPIVYTMGGTADHRVPDDAINVTQDKRQPLAHRDLMPEGTRVDDPDWVTPAALAPEHGDA